MSKKQIDFYNSISDVVVDHYDDGKHTMILQYCPYASTDPSEESDGVYLLQIQRQGFNFMDQKDIVNKIPGGGNPREARRICDKIKGWLIDSTNGEIYYRAMEHNVERYKNMLINIGRLSVTGPFPIYYDEQYIYETNRALNEN